MDLSSFKPRGPDTREHRSYFYLHNCIGNRGVSFRIIRLVGKTNSLLVYHEGENKMFQPLPSSTFMHELRKFGERQEWKTLKSFIGLRCYVLWPHKSKRPTRVEFTLPTRRPRVGKSVVTEGVAEPLAPTLTSQGVSDVH